MLVIRVSLSVSGGGGKDDSGASENSPFISPSYSRVTSRDAERLHKQLFVDETLKGRILQLSMHVLLTQV